MAHRHQYQNSSRGGVRHQNSKKFGPTSELPGCFELWCWYPIGPIPNCQADSTPGTQSPISERHRARNSNMGTGPNSSVRANFLGTPTAGISTEMNTPGWALARCPRNSQKPGWVKRFPCDARNAGNRPVRRATATLVWDPGI
jgi:hypothetical protein